MYTVNGVHPDKGLNEWYVTTGDEIVWHYIDDYKVEQSDMKDESDLHQVAMHLPGING